jgi:Ca-activated chloride channel family protein
MRALLASAVIALFIAAGCDRPEPVQVSVASSPPPAQVTPRDGVGVAIVVDVSGSMGGKVNDSGRQVEKYQVARRTVRELFERSEGFCRRNPERVVEVALYRFDDRPEQLMGFAKPVASSAAGPIQSLSPSGGTAIGRAILQAKQDLDATGLTAKHIVVVTDGENTTGPAPAEVAAEMAKNPAAPAVYMVAFDINAELFKPVKAHGWAVHSAADANELQTALDVIFGENILLER